MFTVKHMRILLKKQAISEIPDDNSDTKKQAQEGPKHCLISEHATAEVFWAAGEASIAKEYGWVEGASEATRKIRNVTTM